MRKRRFRIKDPAELSAVSSLAHEAAENLSPTSFRAAASRLSFCLI